MELRQLRYFVKIAEKLNFSEAARTLHITQSTLSQQIKQLEDELDTQLFDRSTRRMALTEAGESFLPAALKTLHAAELGVQALTDLKQLRTGVLKIGVSYMFSSLLTEAILAFNEQYPKVELKVYYGTARQLRQMLNESTIDFAMAYKSVDDDDHIIATPLFTTALAAIVSPAHPLAHLRSVRLETIAHYPLALPIEGLQARLLLDNLLQKRNLRLQPQMEMNEVNMLLRMTRDGRFLTILSILAVPKNNEKYVVIPIAEKENTLQASVLQRKDHYQMKAATEFLRILTECAVHKHKEALGK